MRTRQQQQRDDQKGQNREVKYEYSDEENI